ncbi:hypothetical protein [Terriglobus sp.]|uniref:hypothetical protein n=1 Tax=Terriglobus sp. TaxID=1889013 RepID=UPI003B00977A
MARYTVEMDDKFAKTLRDLANGGSTAAVIQRAVATYEYLKSQVPDASSPNRVAIANNEGVVQQVVILP